MASLTKMLAHPLVGSYVSCTNRWLLPLAQPHPRQCLDPSSPRAACQDPPCPHPLCPKKARSTLLSGKTPEGGRTPAPCFGALWETKHLRTPLQEEENKSCCFTPGRLVGRRGCSRALRALQLAARARPGAPDRGSLRIGRQVCALARQWTSRILLVPLFGTSPNPNP